MEFMDTTERPLPDTEAGLFVASSEILMMRGRGMSWRQISETTGYTRIQSIRLAHSIFELVSAHASITQQTIMNQRSA